MADNLSELSDDILVAYADEELPEEEMIRLKPLIEADTEATGKVEEFRKSADQLREYFSVDTPAETPVEIAQKIRQMGSPSVSHDNVVSLTSYRQRLSGGIRWLSSGAGLQKIAASLFVGAFVGIGGLSQFDDYGQSGRNQDTGLKFRGVTTTVSSKADGLVLESARGTFRSGSTISKADGYRIHLKTDGADKVWLIYHEKNDAPVTLVSGKSIGSGHSIEYPDGAQKGVKFNTQAAFVTFEVRMQREGQVSRKYYVFGVE